MGSRIKIGALRSSLAAIIARVRVNGDHIVIARHGEPVAALISLADLAELKRLRRMYTTVPSLTRKEQGSSELMVG